jgi:hypothetical protein
MMIDPFLHQSPGYVNATGRDFSRKIAKKRRFSGPEIAFPEAATAAGEGPGGFPGRFEA